MELLMNAARTPGPGTMRDEHPEVATWVENRIALPACCPVSGNPRAGSTLAIRYLCVGHTLEVFSLHQFVTGFVGGHPNGTRHMEAMIQQIAAACSTALGTTVAVIAHLLLQDDQQMILRCRAHPESAPGKGNEAKKRP